MRRLGAALLVSGAAACTGLFVDKGNDYPCDFRAPEAERDKVCAPSEVCGVDNLCRPFHYEGPQFEGKAPLPRLDAGARLHPGQLEGDVKAVGLNSSFDQQGRERTLLVVVQRAGVSRVLKVDRSRPGAVVTDVTATVMGRQLVTATVADSERAVVVLRDTDDTDTFVVTDAGALNVGGLKDIRELRAHEGRVVGLIPQVPLLTQGYLAGDIAPNGNFNQMPDSLPAPDGGITTDAGVRVYEVALVKPQSFGVSQNKPVVVGLTSLGLAWVDESGPSWTPLHQTASDAADVIAMSLAPARLRSDVSGRLLSFANGYGSLGVVPRRVLSTWSVIRSAGEVSVARPWPDCMPCSGQSFMVGFAPATAGQSAVEVLCSSANGGLSAVKVVGSSASAPQQACSVEPLQTYFELPRLAVVNGAGGDAGVILQVVQDAVVSSGVALGGVNGRVYVGHSMSTAMPVFLDRLPVTTGAFVGPDGGAVLVALTERFPAVLLGSEGYEVFDPLADTALRGESITAVVGEAPSWLVLSTGDLVRARFGSSGKLGDFDVQFGPRLVNASDLAVQGPFFAEGVLDSAGRLRSVVATAYDSVYLARDVLASLTDGPNVLPSLRPELTPEPNSPIRSFALERSVLGTDGVNRVRGYVATARNLYLITFGGTPARWSSTPLVLTGEAPVEVWMDHPRGGLGRVGYPSGEVYTLPGAFPLAGSLAASGVLEGVDAGVQVAVEDYDNLAGWPVAYSRAGAFAAFYDVLPDGGLDNKLPDGRLGKPMSWKRIRLADGREPWLGKPGRLQVVKGPRVPNASDAGTTEEWKLLVFTADDAHEAAFATRTYAQ